MTDPLDRLLDAMRVHQAVPFDCAVECSSDARMAELWHACRNGATLLDLYAYTGDRAGYVAAARECVREAVPYLDPKDERPFKALAAVDRWIQKGGRLRHVPLATPFDTQAVLAIDGAYRAVVAPSLTEVDSPAQYVASAAGDDIEAYDRIAFDRERWERARDRMLRRLAKIVRDALRAAGRKPPTLAQLMRIR